MQHNFSEALHELVVNYLENEHCDIEEIAVSILEEIKYLEKLWLEGHDINGPVQKA